MEVIRGIGEGRYFTSRWKERTIAYLMLAPAVTLFALFTGYPLARTILLTLQRYEFLGSGGPNFVGLANYARWLQDERVAETTWITVKFTLMYVPGSLFLGLVAALLIDRQTRPMAASFYRGLLYLPVVLPMSVVFYMWKWIYDPTWGLFNQLFAALGIEWPWKGWLSDPVAALPAIAFMSVWRLMGEPMILFLVGLNNISRELYESARIDGATEWQVIRRITLPLLKPYVLMALVLRLRVLGLSVEPLIMTEGGPVRATMTYGLQAYYIAFRDGLWEMSYGATWFVMLGIVSVLLAYVSHRWLGSET